MNRTLTRYTIHRFIRPKKIIKCQIQTFVIFIFFSLRILFVGCCCWMGIKALMKHNKLKTFYFRTNLFILFFQLIFHLTFLRNCWTWAIHILSPLHKPLRKQIIEQIRQFDWKCTIKASSVILSFFFFNMRTLST